MDQHNQTLRLVRTKGIYDTRKEDYAADGLLILGEIIEAVGSYAELVRQYPEADRMDYSDCYLFPGLINTHVHLEMEPVSDTLGRYESEDGYVNFLRAADNAQKMLQSGVTTIRDAGSSWRVLSLDSARAHESFHLPRMQLAGPPLTITGGHMHFFGGEVDSREELIKAVREHHKRRCGAIKIVASGGQLTPGTLPERESYDVDLITSVTNEAHRLGMTTFSHCLTTASMVHSMRAGVQCIEHGACFVRNRENGLLERIYLPAEMEAFRGDGRWFMNAISNHYHALDHCRAEGSARSAREQFLLEQEQRECEIFEKYVELGLVPVIGTDAGCGLTYFDETYLECEILVDRCGQSPAAVIKAATKSGAECLGLGEETGVIASGYSADLIALPNSPLEDIRALRNVSHVISRGRLVR